MFDILPPLLDGDGCPDDDSCDGGWVTVDCDLTGDLDPTGAGFVLPPGSDGPGVGGVLGRLAAVRDELAGLVTDVPAVLGRAADDRLVAAVAVVHQVANLSAPFDAMLLGEVERRGLHEAHGYPRLADLVVGMCRVRPAAAKARAHAARVFVGRVDLLGQTLPPTRPVLASALAAGRISLDQAATADRALATLPAGVDPDETATVEQALTDLACTAEPGVVARAGRYLTALYRPDGPLPDADIDRRRGLHLRQRDDGMGEIHGILTPETLAAVQAVLHPLAKPVTTTSTEPTEPTAAEPTPADTTADRTGCPSMDGSAHADPRTAPQRLHDALLDTAMRLLGSGTLPDCGGTPVSIAVTMTVDQLREGAGLTETEYGTTIPVRRLLELAAECEYLPVVLSETGGVVHYATITRTAPPAMAKALRARDGGCTFPGCTRPAAWTERHHVIEHRHHGPTALDNLTLVCRYHHRAFTRHGWTVRMTDGRPRWLPPPHLDPHQVPRRNTHWDHLDP